jgi:chitinase
MPGIVTATQTADSHAFYIDGYMPGYEADKLPVERVDFTSLSRLIVARMVPRADGTLGTTFDTTKGLDFARRAGKATHAAKRRAILMIGGEGTHTEFATTASEPAKRKRLVAELVRLVRDLEFDGIDLDWEPIKPEDRTPLLALLDEIRAASPMLELSIPVGWDASVEPFWGELAQRVARVNIMSYAMAGAWQGWSPWHSSALAGESSKTPSSVAHAVQTYLDSGVPRAKLGVGAGFFGMCWQGSAGPGVSGSNAQVVAGDGTLPFSEITRNYLPLAKSQGGAAALFDEAASVPYLTFGGPRGGGPKQCSWLSYEDERSLRAKAKFVKEKKLGGLVIWTLAQGYLQERGSHPLLQALRNELDAR